LDDGEPAALETRCGSKSAGPLSVVQEGAMAIEYLRVTYPLSRQVKANDVLVGDTNVRLRLPADVYVITLDGPLDYDPPSADIVLGGTTRDTPKVVAFVPKRV
jgi:hypothetical protein